MQNVHIYYWTFSEEQVALYRTELSVPVGVNVSVDGCLSLYVAYFKTY